MVTAVLITPTVSRADNTSEADSWVVHGRGPWGLGITISDGIPLTDGDRVNWSSTRNITVVFRLPNISRTDARIYAIMSVMTTGGRMIQVAAGLEPSSPQWRGYVFEILAPDRQS